METNFSVMALLLQNARRVKILKIQKVDDKRLVIHTRS